MIRLAGMKVGDWGWLEEGDAALGNSIATIKYGARVFHFEETVGKQCLLILRENDHFLIVYPHPGRHAGTKLDNTVLADRAGTQPVIIARIREVNAAHYQEFLQGKRELGEVEAYDTFAITPR